MISMKVYKLIIVLCLSFILASVSLADDLVIDKNEYISGVIYNEDGKTVKSSSKADQTPYITQQPVSQSVYVGDDAVFKCVGGPYGISYQWQYNAGTGWYNSPLESATTSSLIVPGTLDRNGLRYRCRIKYYSYTLYSDVVTLTVEEFGISNWLSWIGTNVISPIFSFSLPWGISFGAVIVGVFGAPFIVKAYKKFF